MVKYSLLLKIENQLVKAFYHHKSMGWIIFLPISTTPDNLTSIGQSVLELLSKIAKFDLLTSDKSAILDRALSQINRADLLIHIHHTLIGQSVLELLSKIEKFDL